MEHVVLAEGEVGCDDAWLRAMRLAPSGHAMGMIGLFGRIWNAILVALTVAAAALVVAFAGVRLVGLTPYAVLSGSMEPELPVGSLVYVRAVDPSEVVVGDTITFKLESGTLVTHGTVALRASASPVIQAIIRSCGCPLAVTSANTHGAPAPASFDGVERRVLAGVDVAVDAGTTRCRDASTIVAARDGKVSILREGALSAGQILSVISDMTQISEGGC